MPFATELEIERTARDLAPGVELAAYRLVQEALTNALEHARPTQARVVVRYGEDASDIEVTNKQGVANGVPRNGTGRAGSHAGAARPLRRNAHRRPGL